MERVIKFKAWDEKNKKMVEDINLYNTQTKWNRFSNEVHPTEIVVMQYTGLNDKKGKEIYEGDIISCWLTSPWDEEHIIEVIGIIEFLNGGWWFSTGCIEYNGYYEYDGKIIGNKFEHPELFNKI